MNTSQNINQFSDTQSSFGPFMTEPEPTLTHSQTFTQQPQPMNQSFTQQQPLNQTFTQQPQPQPQAQPQTQIPQHFQPPTQQQPAYNPFGFGFGLKMPSMEEFNEDEFDLGNPFDHLMNDMHFPSFNQQIKNFFDTGNTQRIESKTFKTGSPNAGHGTVFSKSYVSTTKYGPDGKPQRETYQTQSINQVGNDGHRIQEKQEAYKNTASGVEKASHQRMLDNKGHKYVRERNRNTGEHTEHNIFKGMQESDLGGFNNEYNSYGEKIGFKNNYPLLAKMNIGVGKRHQLTHDNFYNLLGSGPNTKI